MFFAKFFAFCLILGLSLAIPFDNPKEQLAVPHVPAGVPPPHVHGVPLKPPKGEDSDLKTDPSTWWHSYYHQSYPIYYYNTHSIPTYYYWPYY